MTKIFPHCTISVGLAPLADYPAVWTDVLYAETIITPPCGRMSQRMRHAKNCLRTRVFFRIRALLALAFSLSLLATQAAGRKRGLLQLGESPVCTSATAAPPVRFPFTSRRGTPQLQLSKQNNS